MLAYLSNIKIPITMKRLLYASLLMLGMTYQAQAGNPIETTGFDKYKNSFDIDLVSVCTLSPEIHWEHYTDTRFAYGVYMQTHFRNRSTASRQFEAGTRPQTLTLDGQTYDLDWSAYSNILNDYADITMDGQTYKVQWNRKYVGVMISPEGRYYMGKKPDRGFYGAARLNMGAFREQFDIQKTTKGGTDNWKTLDTENGESFLAVGGGIGIGCQYWFGKNSHWGLDTNCYVQKTWKFSKDDNNWEWVWGAGTPVDLNISLSYRF